MAALGLVAAIGCTGPDPAEPKPTLVRFEGAVMGTTYHVSVVQRTSGARLQAAAETAVAGALTAVDDAMTTWRESEVTRFNAMPSDSPFALSPETAEVVGLALELGVETDGALDVTVAPLVNAMGFGPAPPADSPSVDELEAMRESIGHDHLTLSTDGTLTKDRAQTQLDLSALAKGYGVDRAALALDAIGAIDYMVEVGGEVRARGRNEQGHAWRIGVEVPGGQPGAAVQRIVPLLDMSMATSGDYRNFRHVGDERISHIFDPRTGRTTTGSVASATVLAADCATADGLATAMMVLGAEGLALAEEREWAVLLLMRTDDGLVERRSSSFDRLLESATEAHS